MKKLSLIFLIITFISCKNESKYYESDKDKINTEISSSSKATEKTNTSLQIVEPVKWTTKTKKISETDYELIIVANIEQGYHLYSQKVPDNGPLPTVFIFENSDDYGLIGTTSEEEGRTVHDPTFEMEIKSFKNKATFKQLIKLKNKNSKIMAEIEFMSCNDTQCLNGYSDIEFQI
ncbi:protein-disulfide reductase DsbD domain-containing protein [Gelidibacter salicanalis]|uniref:Cytochrome C biogenesis protein n=1 Tax=Gelidibacter salicanalis TaxID=291193 RepID=A0A934KRT6_9FLAO|nr:protein-disulfide reductase DsbD domain-containing protein [Gelidibacter salicanalis]MBJ7879612.1 cytochrome C biogenesis protein [Gelidibacter salicanalis]